MQRLLLFTIAVGLSTIGCASVPDDSDAEQTPEPIEVDPSFPNQRIAINSFGFCQVQTDGRLRCLQMRERQHSIRDEPPPGTFEAVVRHRRGFCALADDGEIECWRDIRSTFLESIAFDGRYRSIASDGSMVCAIATDETLHCAEAKAPSSEISSDHEDRRPVQMPGGGYRDLVAGAAICAINDEGGHCFHDMSAADKTIDLDNDDNVVTAIDLRVTRSHKEVYGYSFLRGDFVKATYGQSQICGLRDTGKLRCFDITWRHPAEIHLDSRDLRYRDVLAGKYICARKPDEEFRCTGDHSSSPRPEDAPEGPLSVADIWQTSRTSRLPYYLVGVTADGDLVSPRVDAASTREGFVDVHTHERGGLCAIRDDDTVYCQGHFHYDDDRLEEVTELQARGPRFVSDHGEWGPVGDLEEETVVYGRDDERNDDVTGYEDVQHGNDFGCGLAEDGRVECWGHIMGSKQRAQPPKEPMKAIALGGVYACGIGRDDGRIHCWGTDYFQHVSNAPEEGRFTEFRSTYLNICARRDDGVVQCWGRSFGGTYETPFATDEYALGTGGVCAADTDDGRVHCGGLGIVWPE